MKMLVILNPGAGTLLADDDGDHVQRLRDAFGRLGHHAEVRSIEHGEVEQAAREALGKDFDVIIAGGGDGTALSIANIVRGSEKAFSVLPLGTFNHFAKDLGLPVDLDAAVQALAQGRITELAVGEVNGRIFLNFCALGLHPEMVKHREAQQHTRGRGKWPAMIIALLRIFYRFPIHRITLRHDGNTKVRYTPSVIVCNNRYQMQAFGVQNASALTRELLNIYIARETNRLGVLRLMLRAMFGRLEQDQNFESMALSEFELSTWRRTARISIDGEVLDMRMPLEFMVRRHLLRVLVPAESASGAEPE